MKPIYISAMVFIAAIQTAFAQLDDARNFIVSKSFKEAGANENDLSKVTTQVQYIDGLGRVLQNVTVGQNPDGNDLVEPFAYDAAGRQIKDFLPYVISNGKGKYQQDGITAANTWYTSNSAGLQADGLGRAYIETGYDPSPLKRPATIQQPGNKSQQGTIKYFVNGPNDVPKYDFSPTVNFFSASGNYAEGTLRRIQTTDEQGNESNEYIDMLGQTVCRTRVTDGGTLRTSYIYDDYGQLRVVLQPQYEVDGAYGNMFAYNYDDKGRLTEKVVAGVLTEFVYDKYFRLALSRDRVQKKDKVWTFYKYDAQNRVVLTGEMSDPSSLIRAQIQAIYESYNGHHETADGSTLGYTLSSAEPAVTEAQLRTISFYDTYDFVKPVPLKYTGAAPFNASAHANVKSLPTGGRARVLQSDGTIGNWLTTATYYDSEYRNIQTSRELHDLGAGAAERVSNQYKYNLAPVVAVKKTEQILTGGTNTHTATYAYDHADRLLSIKEQVKTYKSGTPTTKEAFTLANRYNNLGQVKSSFQHSANDLAYRRRTNFTNNIRGWLTDIKTAYVPIKDQPESPFYTISLSYANGSNYTNGNISKMLWATKDQQTVNKGLEFVYDKANRLTQAQQPQGITYTETESDISYDGNGNLLSLTRSGSTGEIDKLKYTIVGNRLTSLKDENTGTLGIPAGTMTYAYDDNGNMITDAVRGTTLTYNSINLPATVTKSGSTYKYTYDASGTKHKYESSEGTIKYAGIFEYRLNGANNDPERVALTDGQAVYRTGVLGFEYYRKDHLGNVKVVYDERGFVLQATDYYAFGLEIDRSTPSQTSTVRSSTNRYNFLGKETQAATGYIDLQARFYDPAIGRFMQVDPLTEGQDNFSPYHYSFNNPIRFSDPDGRWPGEGFWNRIVDGVKSTSAWVGSVLTASSDLRQNYQAEASKLREKTPENNRKRADLKEEVRKITPQPVKAMLDKDRPLSGEAAKVAEGKVNNPSKTNASVDALAEKYGKAGKVMTGAGLVLSGINIATSDSPGKQAAVEAGGWSAAISGGITAAEAAAPSGNPYVIGVAGVVGSVVGGFLGQEAVKQVQNLPMLPAITLLP